MQAINTEVPVILLGGQQNSLAVARNLGKAGVSVAVSAKRSCWGLYSRFCTQRFVIPDEVPAKEFWQTLLLDPADPKLLGAIVFAMNDDALEFLIAHHQELKSRYILDDFDPDMYAALLDKIRTLELAKSIDVPTPKYWKIDSQSDLEQAVETCRFPAMIKPVHTHQFAKTWGVKLFRADDAQTLTSQAGLVLAQDVPFMIVEMVPGPDTALTSFYTYITKDGHWLYEYTKNVIRRYPAGWGIGCCHQSRIHPQTAELGRRFFAGIGFTGFANIEFKTDERDSIPKVIEVNTRFTASHELIVQSGMPLDMVIYCHLTNQPVPQHQQREVNIGSWLPIFDFMAFRELSKRREITLAGWLKDLASRRQVLTVFRPSDPLPGIKVITAMVKSRLTRKTARPE